jgi:hypothetical protein
MADKKISALTAKSDNLDTTDIFAIAEDDGAGGYVSKGITGEEIKKGITQIEFNTQSASYTLVLSDQNKMIEINNASANEVTIPLNSAVAFPIGTQILVTQAGAGQTSIGKSVGVTLYAEDNKLKLVGQYAMCTLIKKSTDLWYVGGNLEA